MREDEYVLPGHVRGQVELLAVVLQSDLELSVGHLVAVHLVVSLARSYLALEIRTCSPIRLAYASKDRTDGLAAPRQLIVHFQTVS